MKSCAHAFALAVAVGASSAWGGVTYLSGTGFYQHTPVNGSGTGVVNSSDAALAVSTNLATFGYTLNSNVSPLGGAGGQAGSSSGSTARVGYVANATTASIALKSGTGVSQVDPAGGTSYAYSKTKIDFRDATPLKWDVTAPGFGPTHSLYSSFTVAGSVGAGGFARCFVNLAFYRNSISGANSLGAINLDTGTISTAGPFNRLLTATVPSALASLSTGTDILMIGTIEFHADNHGGPTEMTLLDSAIGNSHSGAVSTFTGAAGTNQCSEFGNWQTNGVSTGGPDGPGTRAYFQNDLGNNRTIADFTPIHAGIIENGGSATTTITNAPFFGLQNVNGPAMIWNKNEYGDPTLVMNLPVSLDSQLTHVINDSTNPIELSGGFRTTANGAKIIKEGLGPMTLGGATIELFASNGATFDLNDGTTTLSGNLGIGSSAFQASFNVGTAAGSSAGLNIQQTQKLRALNIGPASSARVNLSPRSAIATEALNINTGTGSTGRLNVTDDGIVIRVNSIDPYSTIRNYVISGYNGGSWNGDGIISGAIASDPENFSAVGYARVSDISPSMTTFMGQTVDANDVVVRYTVAGDADLNAIVNLSDFARLASSFNTTGDWIKGDFNYDSLINISDFAILAANFNQPLPGDLPRSTIPEPACAAVLGGMLILVRRRKFQET